MSKNKILFYCTECGNEFTKWQGQCPGCKNWNTIVEAPENRVKAKAGGLTRAILAKRTAINDVDESEEDRFSTSIGELDRVLGGGIVKGSLVLVGGDPGIGKSTLLLQMCKNLADKEIPVLYVSGEESLRQIKLRADRIGKFSDSLKLFCENSLDEVANNIIDMKPSVVIIDSIQTMCKSDVDSAAGSISQVREATQTLLRIAKDENIAIFIIGHVTKEGTVAGPRMLEHMVDTVLYFEGESTMFRILRAVKNRFGSTNEIGVFSMESTGLVEVINPSEHLLYDMSDNEPGSVVTAVIEGTRPILVEIQALVCQTNFNMPRRTAVGIDYNRMNLLMAVMERRMGVRLGGCDAYINVAGGLKINDPSLDLSIIIALYSGYQNIAIEDKTIAFGEVGLTGEVRNVIRAGARVSEAKKLGYKRVILPKASLAAINKEGNISDIELIGIGNIYELNNILKGK